MIEPPKNNPLPWSKRVSAMHGKHALWVIDDANGVTVVTIAAGRMAEARADFILAAVNRMPDLVREIGRQVARQ